MMMRFSEVSHDVVDVCEATTVGRVDGLVVSADPGRVIALRLSKAGNADLLAWADLKSFGPDAVTVSSTSALTAGDDAARQFADSDRDLVGKPAITEKGDTLGTVTDAEFDPETGQISTIRTDAMDLPGDRLRGLGTYAAVFRDA